MNRNNEKIPKMTMCTTTTVAPVGVLYKRDKRSPTSEPTTESTAEQIITDLKLRNRRMAESAGKMINAEMSNAPTNFMASTITTPLTAAIMKL